MCGRAGYRLPDPHREWLTGCLNHKGSEGAKDTQKSMAPPLYPGWRYGSLQLCQHQILHRDRT